MLYNKRHIYVRSPLRVSFIGGGTDLVSFYSQGIDGHVISATIDLYVYVAIKDMFDANVRVHHAEIETQSITSRINHAYSRKALEHFGLFRGAEVVLTSDVMTTGSGLGASSSIMSALIVGCNELKDNKPLGRNELAELTFQLEHESGTIGGKQDQYATAYGGLNSMNFSSEKIDISPVNICKNNLKALEDRLFLVFTNIARSSKLIQQQLDQNTNDKSKNGYFNDLIGLSREFLHELESKSCNLNKLGEYLHQGWLLKKKSNHNSTNPYIDQLYDLLRQKGVLGGKILGAGGGGFFLAYAGDPSIKEKLKYELYPNFIALDVKFSENGTEVIWKNF